MIDFVAARRMMVDGQVRTSEVTDLRLIAAMAEVPRERFVPEGSAGLAYLDRDLPVTPARPGGARCLLKPMVLAKLLQAADIDADHHVLDVGCATGYAAAVLSRLAASVVALEQDPALAQRAGEALRSCGAANVRVVTGPLAEGFAGAAQKTRQFFVQRSNSGLTIDHQEKQRGFIDGHSCLAKNLLRDERFVVRDDTAGIDDLE